MAETRQQKVQIFWPFAVCWNRHAEGPLINTWSCDQELNNNHYYFELVTCTGCLTAPKTLNLEVSRTRLGFPSRASIYLQSKDKGSMTHHNNTSIKALMGCKPNHLHRGYCGEGKSSFLATGILLLVIWELKRRRRTTTNDDDERRRKRQKSNGNV